MNQYERVLEAKRIRMESSTENQHLDQCHTIPINGFDETRHSIHLEPCYKKFTGIIAPHKRKNSEPSAVRSKRSKVDESSRGPGFFPKICFFCKAWKRYFNRKRTVPITTTDAVKWISDAAEMKKDEELLLSIRGVDLIAKEFMMHLKCYKGYIRVLSQSAHDETECPREVGDFNAVKKLYSKSCSLQ